MSNTIDHPWGSRRTPPACFDNDAQWLAWNASARISELRGSHCTDCTHEHQAAMVASGRCEQPQTKFSLDADGFIQGTTPTTMEAE